MHGYTILHGAILTTMAILTRGSQSCIITKRLYGGDLNENGNCNGGKPIMHGYKNLYWGDLNENDRKWQFERKETSHAWLHNFAS